LRWSPSGIGAPRLSPDDFLPWSPSGVGAPHSVLDESTTWSPLGTEEHPSLDHNRWMAALQSDKPSSTDRSSNSFPVSQEAKKISGFAYTNQFANDGPVPMGQSDLPIDCEDQPRATGSNEIAFPSSIDLHLAENSSSTCDNNKDCVALTQPIVHHQSHSYGTDQLELANKEDLVNLPLPVLKQLSKDVAGALKSTRAKEQQKSRESRKNAAEQLRQRKMLQKATTVFKCEHPGCNTTFGRKNERARHIREKHTVTTEAFFCPVVDCPMGVGHKFHRIDKLRDHLRGQKISSCPWSCLLPECSEIAPNKASLFEHFGQHDFGTRRQILLLLNYYGLNPHRELDYLSERHLCGIQGCRFGGNSIFSLSNHMSLAHDGPALQCPIPSCEATFQDWYMTPKHLARDHNHAIKVQFKDEIQKLGFTIDTTFSCPICHHEIEREWKIINHCQEHSPEQLFRASKTLFDAWSFSLGPPSGGLRKEVSLTTENQLLAYIVLGSGDKDFEQAGAKLRASIELSNDGEQN
jgi:hypothetical protein